jgi:superfamily I DNA/RNA helicase
VPSETIDAEIATVAAWIARARSDGVLPSEIGLFVRIRAELARARSAVETAALGWMDLSEQDEDSAGRARTGTMHLAKGLEFKAAAVMARGDGILPLQSRLEVAADETEMDEVYETERHLIYVACTRARDRLLISSVAPGSEFLRDL